jgi:predicted amidophosphoribosyltransferase
MVKKLSYRPCAGCRSKFQATPSDTWCPACAATVREVTVEFSAAEMKRLESQAFVRGQTVSDVIREAVHMLVYRDERPKRRKA